MKRFVNLKVLVAVTLAGMIAPLQAQPLDEPQWGNATLFLSGADKMQVLSAHWSPDGNTIISTVHAPLKSMEDILDKTNSVLFWDAQTGRFIRTLATKSDGILTA